MSVLMNTPNCSFIDHGDYILKLYKSVHDSGDKTFILNSKLFCIKSNREPNHRKRGHDATDIYEETSSVKEMYLSLKKQIPMAIKLDILKKYDFVDTATVRGLSKHFFESSVFDHIGVNGGNNSDVALRCEIKKENFLVPKNSRFFCGCVKEQCQKLSKRFDIVVADPPWWNKFIRRLKNANEKLSYKMMYNEDIASIPVKNLLSQNCLVAVWCTNAPSNIAAVKDIIFPAWGVTYLTTWYWMKVTVDMEPICPFGTGHKKQPFERLILGKVGEMKVQPEKHMFMSVPSALHSHKPPLLDLLSPYVDVDEPQVLELFARYLLPHTTSVGYEPLKWQHIALYETVS